MTVEDIKLVRTCLTAIIAAIFLCVSCVASNVYQERTFKTAALEKGMNATEIRCAWTNPSNQFTDCLTITK